MKGNEIDEFADLIAKAKRTGLSRIEVRRFGDLATVCIQSCYDRSLKNEEDQKRITEELNALKEEWEEVELMNHIYAAFLEGKGLENEFDDFLDTVIGEAAEKVINARPIH